MDKKLRILILSNTPWDDANSFGNSFSNIFGGMEEAEIANIYCRYGKPDNRVVKKYFQITEKSLLKNLLNRKHPPGREVFPGGPADSLSEKGEKAFGFARVYRLQIFFWLRDLVWKAGRWNSAELRRFIGDFSPEVIFQPVYYSNHLLRTALFIKKFTGAPMAGYVSDDVYTMRQFSPSPLFWVNRLFLRVQVRKLIARCGILYVISDLQKTEYEKIFRKECRILTKGASFKGNPPPPKRHNTPLKMVYTGNVAAGRWKTLALVCGELEKINGDKKLAELYIYTKTPLPARIKRRLHVEGSSFLRGGISFAEVLKAQDEADILVYAEPFGLRERLVFRLSFSTKLVDYFAAARCIFAAGPADIASVRHLAGNDAAVIADGIDRIKPRLERLLKNPAMMDEYAVKAWECGKRRHCIEEIQKKLREDLLSLADKR